MIPRVVIGIVGVILVTGSHSSADDGAGVESAENSFEAVAYTGQKTAPSSTPNGAAVDISTGTTYSYEPACVRGEGISGIGFYGCGGQQACGDRGHMFYVWAHYPGGDNENLGAQCFDREQAPAEPSRQVTQALVLRAFQRIPVPASRVSIQPPGGRTLVNLETIFSTQAQEFTRTIGLLGHRVDLAITPSRFEWVTGDGADFATDWAGRRWQKGVPMGEYITHRYDDASDVTTRVDTTWSATYRVDGGPWQDVGGTVTIEGEPFDLSVLSAAPHLVG